MILYKTGRGFLQFIMLLSTLALGCTTIKTNEYTDKNRLRQTTLYCDSFMIYTMCAEDLNGNGEVDLFFFEDDDQIFFYRKGYLNNAITSHLFHSCMQEMDNDLVKIGSKLFQIKKSGDIVQRISIQTKLMAFYVSYLPVISSCQRTSTEDNYEENDFDYNDYF